MYRGKYSTFLKIVKRNILLLSYRFERIGKLLAGRGLMAIRAQIAMAANLPGRSNRPTLRLLIRSAGLGDRHLDSLGEIPTLHLWNDGTNARILSGLFKTLRFHYREEDERYRGV